MPKSSELYNLISISTNAEKLKALIKSPVIEFNRGLKLKRGVIPVELQNEGLSFIITKNELLKLCNWYLIDELDEVELEYLANAIELSEEFNYDESISDELFLLSSPEINGPINKALINKIIARLEVTRNF